MRAASPTTGSGLAFRAADAMMRALARPVAGEADRGAVAQLGERRVRNAKVGSSILLRSTIFASSRAVQRRPKIPRNRGFTAFFVSDEARTHPARRGKASAGRWSGSQPEAPDRAARGRRHRRSRHQGVVHAVLARLGQEPFRQDRSATVARPVSVPRQTPGRSDRTASGSGLPAPHRRARSTRHRAPAQQNASQVLRYAVATGRASRDVSADLRQEGGVEKLES